MNVRRDCFALLVVLTPGIQGCPSHTRLTVQDQEAIQSSYHRQTYFLKQSFFTGPFFEYDDRQLISERAFDERILIQSPSGDPILPCEPNGLLPMGTRVTIREVEFPTGSAMAKRRLKSPRHFTWVMLDTEGQQLAKPFVLVLTQEFKAPAEFKASLLTFLVAEDPRKEFNAAPAEELDAIDHKMLVKGMRADALLRSRGHPDRITRQFVEGVKMEQWQYKTEPVRIVVLKEDKVERWEGFPDLHLQVQPGGSNTPGGGS